MNIETVTTWLEWISVHLPGASWPNWCLIAVCALWLRRWWPMSAKWHKEKGHRWYWPADKLALLATLPARKAWGWWKRRKAAAHWLPEVGKCYSWKHRDSTVYMLIRSVADDVVRYDYCMRDALSPNRYRGAVVQDSAERIADFRRFVNRRPVEVPTELLEKSPDTPKQVAPNTPYGSKPSGEPEWRRAVDELEGRVGRMEAAHYSLDWIVAQQMRDPHFEPVGTQPVEGDIVYNPDKKQYYVVESVSDEVYLDNGGSYHCWAFMSPAVVPDDRFGGEQRPRVLRRNPQ